MYTHSSSAPRKILRTSSVLHDILRTRVSSSILKLGFVTPTRWKTSETYYDRMKTVIRILCLKAVLYECFVTNELSTRLIVGKKKSSILYNAKNVHVANGNRGTLTNNSRDCFAIIIRRLFDET